MPPDSVSSPNPAILSRELYNLILMVATGPVLIFLIWLSWLILNRLMSPMHRQERRNREIRKAVAARKARLAAAGQAITNQVGLEEAKLEQTKPPF